MKHALKMLIVLGAVCFFAGFSLVWLSQYAQPKIEENERKIIEQGIYSLLPEAENFSPLPVEKKEIYKATDKEGHLIGYAFIAEGSGYQDKIRILAATDKNFDRLLGIEILKQKETPGLGGKISDEKFKKQFKGMDITRPIEVDAITGATISSKAVVKILTEEIESLKRFPTLTSGE